MGAPGFGNIRLSSAKCHSSGMVMAELCYSYQLEKRKMSLYLHYKPTKVDLIRGILDYWDPCRAKGTENWYELFYNYEAETICQTLRKNSKVETVAKNVKSLIDHKLELEGKKYRVDMDNATRVAESMIATVKRMK